jgi:hypothetical protein
VRLKAAALAGTQGRSAREWEILLFQQLLRQSDGVYAGFSENAVARQALSEIQQATGISMSAEGTPEYSNASINASQLPLTASAYLAAGNLPQMHHRSDLLTYAYSSAVQTPDFAGLPVDQQRQILGQLIMYSEALQLDPRASAIQRRMADAATRRAGDVVRANGWPDMPLTAADRRLGQSMAEEMLGAAIAGAMHRGRLIETEANRLASTAPRDNIEVPWGKGINAQGKAFEDHYANYVPNATRTPPTYKTWDYIDFGTGAAILIRH